MGRARRILASEETAISTLGLLWVAKMTNQSWDCVVALDTTFEPEWPEEHPSEKWEG